MRLTIEVQCEADGLVAMKRTVILSEDFSGDAELEAAATAFIREAKLANEKELDAAPASPSGATA